jgi:hypothetical protein
MKMKNIGSNRSLYAVPVLLLAMTSWAGCHQLDINRGIPWETRREKQKEVVTKVNSTWVDAIRQQPEKAPTRGFGGRIFFYGKDQDKPIHIEGRIVVYGFDETGRDPSNPTPNRKFIFPAEEIQKLCSESPIGPAYSVWLPWDEVGGEQKRISLIVRFQPDKGPVVVGKQLSTLLPGRQPIAGAPASGTEPAAAAQNGPALAAGTQGAPAAAPQQSAGRSVQPVAFTEQQQAAPAPKPRMKTTTIPMGSRFGRGAKPPATLRNQKQEIHRMMEQLRAQHQVEATGGRQGADQLPALAVQRGVHSEPATPPAPASPVSPLRYGRSGWQRTRAASQLGQPPQPLQRFPAGTTGLFGSAPSGSR